MTSVAILGGGITGCVLAAELSKHRGFSIELFEKADRLGGLHHSPVVNGLAYDVGAFFFEASHVVFETFPGLVDQFVRFPVKVTAVTDEGKLDRYPVTLRGYIRSHGLPHFGLALADLLACKLKHRRRDSMDAFVKYYLGATVYERSGLKAYVERLYGMPAAEVDLMFARQRMGDVERWASFRNIIGRFLRRPSSLWTESYYEPTALARPEAGFSAAYRFIETALARQGVGIHKGVDLAGLKKEGSGFRLHCRGRSRTYDYVVSTVPLPITARLLGVPLEHRFETVGLATLFYRFRGSPGYEAAVLSNFTHSGEWKRIIDFSHFYGERDGRWLSVEVPTRGKFDAQNAARRFRTHVRSLGLFEGDLTLQGHAFTPDAYPIYRTEGIEKLAADKQRIIDTGILLAGRQGQFEYISSEQAARSAAELAEQIIRAVPSAQPMAA